MQNEVELTTARARLSVCYLCVFLGLLSVCFSVCVICVCFSVYVFVAQLLSASAAVAL